MKTNISVVIPAYNEQENIAHCLDALVLQLNAGDEVIVVDNNSTDNTVAIARSYRSVRVLSETLQGQVFAQARGFDSAKNAVIARIDADTVVGYDWVESIRKSFAGDVNVVTGPGVSYDLVTRIIPDWMMGFWTFRTNKMISGHYPVWGSNFAFTSDAWVSVKNHLRYKQDIWEDFEMGILLKRAGYTTVYDTHLVVGYSNRNALNARIVDSVRYQYRACRTYWVTGMRFVAVLSALERTLLLIIAAPFGILERFLQFATRRGRFTAGRRKILFAS